MTRAQTILAAVQRCPGLTARGIAEETGLSVATVHPNLRMLELAGCVTRSHDWPAGWEPAERADDLLPDPSDLDVVETLLTEAMQLPEWQRTPPAVRHKVEHACVEIMRARGDVPTTDIYKTTSTNEEKDQ